VKIKAPVYTLEDTQLQDCPNCGGIGIVTNEELDYYRSMVSYASQRLDLERSLLGKVPFYAGLLAGLIVGISVTAMSVWLF
jgi:hypothetical protein